MRPFVFLLGLAFSALASAETMWLSADAPSTRFPDSATAGHGFSAGDKVEVLVREGERARVKSAAGFGWIAASALTDLAPENASPAFDLQALQEMMRKAGQ